MDQRRLHDHLSALHKELTASGPVDAQAREQLKSLAADIRTLLDAGPGEPDRAKYQGLRARLSDAAATFETSHPKLATTIEQVVDTLAFYNL